MIALSGGYRLAYLESQSHLAFCAARCCRIWQEMTIPLIGIAPWGIISQRAHMDPRANVPGGVSSSANKLKKKAAKYQYMSKTDPTSQVSRCGDKGSIPLEPNHTHFIFHDDGTEGTFYTETDLRSTFEDFIARGAPANQPDIDGSSPDIDGTSLFGNDEDGDKFLAPPMVVLVVGGGPGSFKMALQSLEKQRPVVVIADSGGAAKDIFDYVTKGELDPTLPRKYSESMIQGLGSSGRIDKAQSAVDVAMQYLPKIKELGQREVGVQKSTMLTFFSLSKDFSEYSNTVDDFSTLILNAILSDCESTGDAVVHAVRWRNHHVIRKQLEISTESDPQGIARAFQNALLGRDHSAIRVLIQYNVDVRFVSLAALVKREDENERTKVPYTWENTAWWLNAWQNSPFYNSALVQRLMGYRGPKGSKGGKSSSVTPSFDLEEVLKIRFTDTKVKPMPDQIEQWVKEDNDERRTEKQNGMRPGEWMQDELNDIAVAQAMRNKEDTRTYEEIKEGIKEESKASGGIIDPKVYPAPRFLKTDWADLMCWAVCERQPDIAELLWVKTREPLRYAIWASQIAGHLATLENTAIGQETCREHAATYESWAVSLLDQCSDHELAAKMLCVTHETYGRQQSALDDATDPTVDPRSWRTHNLISAPHTRTLVIQAFDGDFPGSMIRIKPRNEAVPWWKIAAQIIFFFLPIIELQERSLSKSGSTTDKAEADAEEAEAIKSRTHKAGDDSDSDSDEEGDKEKKRRKLSRARTAGLDDDDLGGAIWFWLKPVKSLWRLNLFFKIPRVSFFLKGVFYTAYVFLFVYLRIGLPMRQTPSWMRETGMLDLSSDTLELDFLLCAWSFMRLLEEFQPLLLIYEGWSSADVRRDYLGKWLTNSIEIVIVGLAATTTTTRLAISTIASDAEPFQLLLAAIQFVDALLMIMFLSRFVSMMSVFRGVSILTISLSKMAPEIMTWGFLIIFPTLGFSLAFTMILPSQVYLKSDARWPFFIPFWGLLGDLDIDTMSEMTPVDSYFADHFAHALLWIYMFVATIVLVNLLIAQMSSSYAKVEEAASQFHNWAYMELVRDSKDQLSPWQPPLNIVQLATYFSQWLCGGCRNPKHDTPKGFRWNPDSIAESKFVMESQRKFAIRSIKKRKAHEEGSVDNKVEQIMDQQKEMENQVEQITETIGAFLETMRKQNGRASPTKGAGAAADAKHREALLKSPTSSKAVKPKLAPLASAPGGAPAGAPGGAPASPGTEQALKRLDEGKMLTAEERARLESQAEKK